VGEPPGNGPLGRYTAPGGARIEGEAMSTSFAWVCPHCQRNQVVTEANFHEFESKLGLTKLDIGDVGLEGVAVSCLNGDCQKLTLKVSLKQAHLQTGPYRWILGAAIQDWALIPESSAKPQPDFIPAVLRQDYLEACRIRDLSPKASATLARRCLQGMIRNFCEISKDRLIDEIKELRGRVDADKAPRGVTHESVDAIDSVRGVGNIGAHMEKDIDLIIDIDPGEAQVLIELIETLFDEWYVARDTREKRFAGIKALGEEKKAARKPLA